MNKIRLKTILKWTSISISLIVVILCSFLYKSLIVDAENLIVDNTETNKVNENKISEYSPTLTSFPKSPISLNNDANFMQNIGGSNDEKILNNFSIGSRHYLIFESSSYDYDIKKAGINIAEIEQNGYINSVPKFISDEKYIDSSAINESVYILTFKDDNLNLYLYQNQTSDRIYSVNNVTQNAKVICNDSSVYILYTSTDVLNFVNIKNNMNFAKCTDKILNLDIIASKTIDIYYNTLNGSFLCRLDYNLKLLKECNLSNKNFTAISEFNDNCYFIENKDNRYFLSIYEKDFTYELGIGTDCQMFFKNNGYFYIILFGNKTTVFYFSPCGALESKNSKDFNDISYIASMSENDNTAVFLVCIINNAGQKKSAILSLYGTLMIDKSVIADYGNSIPFDFFNEENRYVIFMVSSSDFAEYTGNNGLNDIFILYKNY